MRCVIVGAQNARINRKEIFMRSKLNKWFSVRVAVTLIVTMLNSFAHAGADTSGGGSGLAAEISRATEAFIVLVEKNPKLFSNISAKQLRALDPDIRLTGAKITSASGDELEAWSDSSLNYSQFNLQAWIAKDDWAKIQLAGHERLVLAGLENSNRYDISNRVYEVKIDQFVNLYGKVKDICSFGAGACESKQFFEAHILSILSSFMDQTIDKSTALENLKDTRAVIESEIQVLVLRYNQSLRLKTNRRAAAEKYNKQIRLAFEVHFNPIFVDVQNLIMGAANRKVKLDIRALKFDMHALNLVGMQMISQTDQSNNFLYKIKILEDIEDAEDLLSGEIGSQKRIASRIFDLNQESSFDNIYVFVTERKNPASGESKFVLYQVMVNSSGSTFTIDYEIVNISDDVLTVVNGHSADATTYKIRTGKKLFESGPLR